MGANQSSIDLEAARIRAAALDAVARYQKLPLGLRKLAKEQSRQFEGLARVIESRLSRGLRCDSI